MDFEVVGDITHVEVIAVNTSIRELLRPRRAYGRGRRRKLKGRAVLCVSAGKYLASLEPHKLYQSLPDPRAEADGLMRVIDESGEDYLFPKQLFVSVVLPDCLRPIGGSLAYKRAHMPTEKVPSTVTKVPLYGSYFKGRTYRLVGSPTSFNPASRRKAKRPTILVWFCQSPRRVVQDADGEVV